MIASLNLTLMVSFTVLFVLLYNRSVSPAALEKKMGAKAYDYCGKLRAVAITFLLLVMATYIVFNFYPYTFGLPEKFGVQYWVLALIAIIIAISTTFMVVTGMKDAGDEAVKPSQASQMFGGIYERIRHPQTWEYGYFFVVAFLLDSPFLVIYSLVWFPLMYIMMRAEEKDLLIRYGMAYQEYMKTTGRLLPKKKANK
jgi:protein-S-isoprenylcysteine O-methyltransferase Ste14